jgi:hypothetical protein
VGLADRIAGLAGRLRQGTWRPGPVRFAAWPFWGKRLTVTIPTVEDRIVRRALRHAAEPVLLHDAYPSWMFGWRPRAGRVEAVAAAAAHLAAGRRWVADLGVAAATSGADLEQTVGWLARWISDGAFFRLVRRALAALPTLGAWQRPDADAHQPAACQDRRAPQRPGRRAAHRQLHRVLPHARRG